MPNKTSSFHPLRHKLQRNTGFVTSVTDTCCATFGRSKGCAAPVLQIHRREGRRDHIFRAFLPSRDERLLSRGFLAQQEADRQQRGGLIPKYEIRESIRQLNFYSNRHLQAVSGQSQKYLLLLRIFQNNVFVSINPGGT